MRLQCLDAFVCNERVHNEVEHKQYSIESNPS